MIHRGIVMHGLHVMTSGRMWGEEVLLDDSHTEHTPPTIARCMTYVEVYSISKSALFKVPYPLLNPSRTLSVLRSPLHIFSPSSDRTPLARFSQVTNSFSDAKRLVRRRAVIVIARRALVRLVRNLRLKKQQGDGRSFMELVLDAASTSNGNLAKVVGSEQGGAAYLLLQDEIASTRAGIDDLRKEVGAEMSAVRDGLNRLLSKEGLAAVRATVT